MCLGWLAAAINLFDNSIITVNPESKDTVKVGGAVRDHIIGVRPTILI